MTAGSTANENASGAWVTLLRVLDGEHPPRRDWRPRLHTALRG
nr:K512 [uncultured bacterium]